MTATERDRITPEAIEPTEDEARLRVRWKDGHVSEYEPRYLRMRCPCAACVDEYSGVRTLTEADVPEDVYPLEIRYVGRYALRVQWSDFHDTGIYSFETLRGLCPCEACAGGADAAGREG